MIDEEWKLLEEELAEQLRLADIGEVAGLMAHEFNDVLNTILLHVALLEQSAPEKLRPDLAEIQKQSKNIAELVKQFQQYRRRQRPDQAVDLNRVITDAVSSFFDDCHVVLGLQPDLPPVLGNAYDLKRLVVFLLRNAHGASSGQSGTAVRTQHVASKALLSVEDSGPSIRPEALPHVFDPSFEAREGTNSLELAACKRLVRRLKGEILCENRSEGGVTVIVKLRSTIA